MLEDAFAHHVWATLRLIDACMALSPNQLETAVPGTYGTIVETMRHLVGSDAWYLFRLSREGTPPIDDEHQSLPKLRAAVVERGAAWTQVLAANPDPDALVMGLAEDGTEVFWPTSIRVAQVLHHGTDHRSQICTALTTLGVEPPSIDVWDFGEQDGRLVEGQPPS